MCFLKCLEKKACPAKSPLLVNQADNSQILFLAEEVGEKDWADLPIQISYFLQRV